MLTTKGPEQGSVIKQAINVGIQEGMAQDWYLNLRKGFERIPIQQEQDTQRKEQQIRQRNDIDQGATDRQRQ
jgi:hypothetical protein